MEATLSFSFRICAARSTFTQRYSTCWMPSPNLARYFAMAPSPPGSRVVRMSRENPSARSEEHTSELQSHLNLVCHLLLATKIREQWLSGAIPTLACVTKAHRTSLKP